MDYPLENFISYCDNMMIAEESVSSVKSKYKQFQIELNKIKDELRKENNISKLIELYKKQSVVIDKFTTEIKKESRIGFKDIGMLLKYSILPLLFGGITISAMKMPNVDKKNKAAGAAMTACTLAWAVSEIKSSTDVKSNTIKVMNRLKERNESYIEYFEYAKKNGIINYNEISHGGYFNKNDIDDTKSNANINDIRKSLPKSPLLENIQILLKPSDDPKFKNMSQEKLEDFMEDDVLAFMKKYAASPTFKSKYKKYLYMVNIYSSGYESPFSITITDYQSGYDDNVDDNDNSWYLELLEIGEIYIRRRFKNWHNITWDHIGTGDGDEGTIYVSLNKGRY